MDPVVHKTLLVLVVATLSGPTSGQELQREFTVDMAEQLGRNIFRYDAAAAVSSDLLIEKTGDASEAGVIGWVTTEDTGSMVVTFVGVSDGDFVARYDVRLNGADEPVLNDADGRSLTETELTKYLARLTAGRRVSGLCSSRYNTVILADPERDGWLVYFLAASSEYGVVPVGGHYRVSVSEDGTRVAATDKLYESCEIVELDNSPEAVSTALPIVQEVGSVPLETSVFLSLIIEADLSVQLASDGSEWLIRNGLIELVGLP